MPLKHETHPSDHTVNRSIANNLARAGLALPAVTAFQAGTPAQRTAVVQLQYAERNWSNMNTYNSGSAGAAVTNAFNKAGYTLEEITPLVVQVLKDTKFDRELFGHASGNDNGDGQQGKTTPLIEECKTYLINWAGGHPKGGDASSSSSSSSSSSPSYKPTTEEIERHTKDKETRRQRTATNKLEAWESSQETYVAPAEARNRASEYLIQKGLEKREYPPKLNRHEEAEYQSLINKLK